MGAKPDIETQWEYDVSEADVQVPTLAGYDIVREVGQGAMGHVYECTSPELGSVAVKVLNVVAESSPMAVERFRREVTVGDRIGHAGIPTVYESGRLPDGRFYYVMELLRGSDLEGWWDTPGHTRAEALDLICQGLEPLAAAHRHGVVHRDLKPENLFVEEDGHVRLLDFGVARSPDASQNVKTATGIAVGTPIYMSPEQATRPAEIGPASDVWSAGVMLYEALSGELPFEGESPHAVVLKACTEEPAPLDERVPEVHPELLDLVGECLTKDASKRPQDGEALHSRLSALMAREDVRATLGGPAATPSFNLSHSSAPSAPSQPPEVAPPTEDTRSRRPLALFALVALIAVAGVVFWMMRSGPAVEAAGAPRTFEEPAPAREDVSPEPAASAPPVGLSPETAVATTDEPDDSVDSDNSEARGDRADAPSREVEDAAQSTSEPRRRRRRRRSVEASRPRPVEESVAREAPTSPAPATAPATMRPEPETVAARPTPPPPRTPTPRPAPAMTTSLMATPRPAPMRPPPSEMRPERPGFVTF